jgi:hypothetical protein
LNDNKRENANDGSEPCPSNKASGPSRKKDREPNYGEPNKQHAEETGPGRPKYGLLTLPSETAWIPSCSILDEAEVNGEVV